MTVHRQQISVELTEHRQQIFAEMTAHYQRMEQRLDHDLSYICDSMRYLDAYSAASTRSMIGRFLFHLIVLGNFLLPALHFPPGLLLFHHRHLLHSGILILILMISDPF